MKLWMGYGSEHSANLVMLGKFKSAEDATDFLAELEKLERLIQEDDSGDDVFREIPKNIMDEVFITSASPKRRPFFVPPI